MASKPDYVLRIRDRELKLQPGEYVIGRSSSCDIVLDDGVASRQHAKLSVTDQGVLLADLESRNGVLLNDEPLRHELRIKDRDRFTIGKTVLMLIDAARRARENLSTEDGNGSPRRSMASTWRPPPDGKGLSGITQAADLAELEAAAQEALEAARVMQDATWIDRVFVEYARQGRVPNGTLLAEMRQLLERFADHERTVILAYLETMEERRDTIPVQEQVRLRLIEALSRSSMPV